MMIKYIFKIFDENLLTSDMSSSNYFQIASLSHKHFHLHR